MEFKSSGIFLLSLSNFKRGGFQSIIFIELDLFEVCENIEKINK